VHVQFNEINTLLATQPGAEPMTATF